MVWPGLFVAVKAPVACVWPKGIVSVELTFPTVG